MPKYRAPDIKQFIPDQLEGITDFIFGATPEEQMMQSLGPAPLVSIYKNAAARRLGTQEFLKKAMEISPDIFEAASKFAQRYPRVAAHMKLGTYIPEIAEVSTSNATTINPISKVRNKIPIEFNPRAIHGPSRNITETMFHEGTHAAQALGNRKMNSLYQLFNRMVGYVDNPLEIAARNAGWRNANPDIATPIRPARALMQQLLETAARPEDAGKLTSGWKAIEKIMQERGMLRDPNVTAIPSRIKR